MSTSSRDEHRPPLASSTAGGITSTPHTPTIRNAHKQSPSSSTHALLHRTPPSPSAALPSAANVRAALWTFRNASAASSAVGSEGVLSTPIPRVEGTTPEAAPTPVSSPSHASAAAAAAASSDDILRGIYNEKLHASVRSIITTLSNELPEDHIFLQLLADPSTQQYCKVRLAEVVEGFLYSTQAEQYHELATELARREQDCETQRRRIEELEAALALAVHEAEQLQQQQQRRLSEVHESSSHASRSPPTPPSHIPLPDAAAESSSAPPVMRQSNPMEDEEARRELLRVLEQATHDQELSRCRLALQAVAKVVAVGSAEPKYEDKYFYEGELMGELYTCVQSLLQYVDGALDSQERLRWEVQEQHPWMLRHRGAEEGSSALSSTAVGRAAVGVGGGGGNGSFAASDYSTPHRPRMSIGGTGQDTNGSVFNSAVSSHLPSSSSAAAAHAQGPSHGVAAIQKRREELQRLSRQLRQDQLTSRNVLEQLAHGEAQHRREAAQFQRALEAARHDATAAATTAAEAQHAKADEERRRAESVAAAAAERTELRDKLADVQAQLAATAFDVQAARREGQTLAARVKETEKREADVLDELATVKTSLREKGALLREQQAECTACHAELTGLKALHQADVDALQDAARELLCLRVEKTMTGLSALYHEAKATKAELLEREGYRQLCGSYSTAAAAQHEAARHAQVQLQVAETAHLEKAMTHQSVADALGVLLRSMWADDATEAALGDASADYDGVSSDDHRDPPSATPESSHKEGATAGAAVSRAQRYRLPSTLPGLCSALDHAYANVRARHHARQKTIESLRTTLIGKDIELRSAQANETQLRDLLKAERAKEEQWRSEMAQLNDNNPMRDLLARQDALLNAVSEERNALRRQWNSLSGEYIALEQRNGVLHARCAEKEHENARLSGMLLRGETSNNATPQPAAPAAAAQTRTQPTQDKHNTTPGSHPSFSAASSSTGGSDALRKGGKDS
ncbi:hypothetical protein ABB37_06914 [Leptomonas pyrrhocoris]|uniref:Uncharacterized protein n=1 Tax=Leptomonas pyrrhocoris TaxID=157538 RepID=A0A0M9FWJ7_LEPPY|nr:hypothetical protein ABB37_06914 [Leptomonas pyrrhocoris]KPA77535.1 hypothetical protein ABB37_06914 [Leptomonas pyrrhocoris]|eukprot:XP_015655974.1 hypothetical protein ABB37_06914 [Leptomonas pyrrhocoris]